MTKSKNKRTDKQREEQRCSGCDCYETADGCECKIVSCSECCYRDHLYNMYHDEYHTDFWFEMDYEIKMNEILCKDCNSRLAGHDEENDY